MKAVAVLKMVNCVADKHRIVRNLSRIMNIRILNIDVEKRTIEFLCPDTTVFERTRYELGRLGYPILSCSLSGFATKGCKSAIEVDNF